MSFPELSSAIARHSRPTRTEIIRAKRHLLSSLSDGRPHPSQNLTDSVAALFGAEPLKTFSVTLSSLAAVDTAITAGHQIPASIRAHVAAREALAELAAEGMLIAAGKAPVPAIPTRTFTYEVRGTSAGVEVDIHSPAVLSDTVQLPHRLRHPNMWTIETDIFTADLAPLDLDLRTQRSLREAIDSYHRGVYLAAASLLGAAVEGAWYAAAQRLRTADGKVDELADKDRTAQLQAAVADALRNHLPASHRWAADSLSVFARLMRDIRNYGVHPRHLSDGELEIHFEEDASGLLFLLAHRHLKLLAQLTSTAASQA